MDVASLLKQFFPKTETITIDVFDAKNIYDVYHRIVGVLTQHIDIETTVLQAMSYCFYEVLDNVLTHSGKELGTVITNYNAEKHLLDFLVADDGKGIRESLAENEEYATISEAEALTKCIQDSVTDGKGMGFGLYSTSLLARDAGVRFEIYSGTHKLVCRDNAFSIEEAPLWQGTVVFMEITTNKEIDPKEVVANRTDCATQYNELFLNDTELEQLW